MLDKKIFKNEDNKNFIIKLIILSLFFTLLFLLYKISNILIILSFSLFLNILFSPILNKLNKWKIGNGIGIILIYIIIFIFILITFFSIVPIFVKQISTLIDIIYESINDIVSTYNSKGIDGFLLPDFVKKLLYNLDLSEILNTIQQNIGEIYSFLSENLKKILTNGVGIISSITNTLMNFVLVFIFTFFIALERKQIRIFFYKIIPYNYSKYLLSKEQDIIKTLYNWLIGQLILGISIFLITLIGLLIVKLFGVKIDEIFTLALIAGMMEFIPYVGPFIALLPALAIALGFGLKSTIVILILYIAIQQLENNILVPYIMGKNLLLSSFAVLISMIIGASLFGIIGIIISIPIVAIIQLFLKDFLEKRKI